MTIEELELIRQTAKNDIKLNPKLRLGQAFFNELNRVYPMLANEIRATKYDPFHLDSVLPTCYDYLLNFNK